MSIRKEIRDRLFRIFRPNFWTQISPTCDKYSNEIENLIDNNADVEVLGQYEAKIGGKKIWIENYPYDYGYEIVNSKVYYYMYGVYFHRSLDEKLSVLPTARVRKKLKNYIADHESKMKEGFE